MRVVVPRAAQQAGALSDRLRAAGLEPVEVPVIAIEGPEDGGAALQAALANLGSYDWLVVTSTNAATRVSPDASIRNQGIPADKTAVRIAAVGPGTADALKAAGVEVALVPARNLAEGLLDEFPDGPGSVLLPQADRARPVLADGLRAKGWTVDAVVAYRTVAVTPPSELIASARGADAIAFTSASTVDSYVSAAGADAVPGLVVCIGPVTAEAAEAAGLRVAAVAEPHTLDGLVAAVERAAHP